MSEPAEEFSKERKNLNEIVMKYADEKIKRYFSLDAQAYRAGALSCKTKEMMGLAVSLALRCDDCVKYHALRCREEQVSDKEFEETVSIALVVGGSITIPHIRRAFKFWDGLKAGGASIKN